MLQGGGLGDAVRNGTLQKDTGDFRVLYSAWLQPSATCNAARLAWTLQDLGCQFPM